MPHFFQPIIHYLHQNPGIGVLIAFVVALAESLPLVGTIIPGSVTMTILGTMIGTGVLPGFTTLAWASIGALIGDTIGFTIGYVYTESVQKIWPFKKYPHWLQASEKFFKKHGGKSIIFGRFVGPARSTIPLVAGLLKMTWARFILAAIPSAIMWAVLYMVPGILIGALAVELPPHVATEFIVIGLLVIVALWLAFWAIQYFFSQLARTINNMIDNLWDVLIRHKPSRPFIRLIAVKGNPTDHYQLMLFLLFLLSGLLFLFVFYSVKTSGWLTGLNVPLFNLLQSIRTKHFNEFFIIVTLLSNSRAMTIAGGLISVGLGLARQYRAAIHFLIIDLLMAGAITFFKHVFYNPRPSGFQNPLTSSSFPSGHAGMSFVIFATLAYFTGKLVKPTYKWIPYTLSIILILLAATSRLYLGAHWLTDILGSFTLGFTILFIVIINYRRRALKRFKTINKPYWYLLIFIGILLPVSIHAYKNYHVEMQRYTPVWNTETTTVQRWWHSPTSYLPLYRLNRFGKPIQPFNLQWASDLSSIQALLESQKWVTLHLKYSVKGTLKRFAKRGPYHLPLLPWLYHHKPPQLIMAKVIKRTHHVIELRLWDSDLKFTNSDATLWIGTINYQQEPSKKAGLKKTKHISLEESGGIKELIQSLKSSDQHQYKLIVIPRKKQPKKILQLHWDGHVMIIRNTDY